MTILFFFEFFSLTTLWKRVRYPFHKINPTMRLMCVLVQSQEQLFIACVFLDNIQVRAVLFYACIIFLFGTIKSISQRVALAEGFVETYRSVHSRCFSHGRCAVYLIFTPYLFIMAWENLLSLNSVKSDHLLESPLFYM